MPTPPFAGDSPPPFDFLREAEDEKLASLLGSERPPTVALVLSHFPPERAGEVLSRLTPALQAEIVRRLIDLENTDPETLREVERALEARWSRQFADEQRRAAGPEAIAKILAACDPRSAREDSRQPRRARSLAGRAIRRSADRVRGHCPIRRCDAAGGLSSRRAGSGVGGIFRSAAGDCWSGSRVHVSGRSETIASQAGSPRSDPPQRRRGSPPPSRRDGASNCRATAPNAPPLERRRPNDEYGHDPPSRRRAAWSARRGVQSRRHRRAGRPVSGRRAGRGRRNRGPGAKRGRRHPPTGRGRRTRSRPATGSRRWWPRRPRRRSTRCARPSPNCSTPSRRGSRIGKPARCIWPPPSPRGSSAANCAGSRKSRSRWCARRWNWPPAAPTCDCISIPEDYKSLGRQVRALIDAMSALGDAEVTPDPAIGQGGCRVETRFGAIDQQIESQLKRIEEELVGIRKMQLHMQIASVGTTLSP